MLWKLLERLVKKIKKDEGYILSREWTVHSLTLMFYELFLGVVRGSIRSLFFHSSKGIVIIKKRVIMRNSSHLTVGKNFIAEEGCEINALSKRGIILGDRVTVGAYALIRPTNYYGGEIGEGLRVGDNSNIGPYNYIGCSGYIEIGNDVMISPRVSIYSENHVYDRTDIPMKRQGVKREFVVIEDDCWIAANSVILAGVTIGKGSIVAAGSIVTKDVPPFSIVAGNPAKIIKRRKISIEEEISN